MPADTSLILPTGHFRDPPLWRLRIGLYITKKFTELLDGKITVESEIGEGSTFTVAIPYST